MYLVLMIHCSLAITDIPCSCCKGVSLRNHAGSDKYEQENGGDSWGHFQRKLFWPRSCWFLLDPKPVRFELQLFSCFAIWLIGDQTPSDKQKRQELNANNTDKELK